MREITKLTLLAATIQIIHCTVQPECFSYSDQFYGHTCPLYARESHITELISYQYMESMHLHAVDGCMDGSDNLVGISFIYKKPE